MLRQRISIHTPAKGVTIKAQLSANKIQISIHTPAKGVTITSTTITSDVQISIHTPAKGVTDAAGKPTSISLKFQSTLPRRE